MTSLFICTEKLKEMSEQIKMRVNSIRKELEEIEAFSNNLLFYAKKLEEKEFEVTEKEC